MKDATVLVIGTGNFGRHYAEILSSLNERHPAGIPAIRTLIVTKTDQERARCFALDLKSKRSTTLPNVIGAKVCNEEDLAALLDRYHPTLTCIAASDKTKGDRVHVDYAKLSMKQGHVLCEKPFSSATGDGTSLKFLERLLRIEGGGAFGLELPLYFAGQWFLTESPYQQKLLQAQRINFYWGSRKSNHTDLIDNLAPHPWSLIPEWARVAEMAIIENNDQEVNIFGRLYNEITRRNIETHMTLSTENDFRAMEIDGETLCFANDGPLLKIIGLKTSLKKAKQTSPDYSPRSILTTIENPLARHIVASLKGEPLVDLTQTYRSQLFLETIKGYQGSL